MAKKKLKRIYHYKCSLTDESFKTTREAPNPEELMSVKAYYQLHPENDDRPEIVLKKINLEPEIVSSSQSVDEIEPPAES